ncbi:MAG: MEDS domain-containing protein [Nitrososphaera sp.]
MESIKQNKISNNHNYHPHYSDRMVHGNSLEIAETMAKEKNLIEQGSHTLLVYNDLKAFREIYTQYARALLPQNEIIVIGTQYESINAVKSILRLVSVDVERYLNDGTLFIVDAQEGYQDADTNGMWKFAISLLSRAKKEGRQGVTWFGDAGSFFSFEKIEELMQYELSLPQKYEDPIKTVCSYHLRDFEKLNEAQKTTLFGHHFKSIMLD